MGKKQLSLEQICQSYADLSVKQEVTANQLRQSINVLINNHLKEIRTRQQMMESLKQQAVEYIEEHPEEFDKPKTRVLHGVKCGLRKQTGKLDYADEEKLIKKIEKEYDGAEGVLIKTKRSIVKKGLEGLSAEELKSLGVSIIDVDDKVVFDLAQDGVDELLSIINFGEANA